jgi:hypothetical protein
VNRHAFQGITEEHSMEAQAKEKEIDKEWADE